MGTLIKIARTEEVSAGQKKAFEVEGKRIAIFNIDGQFSAIDDTCTHAGGPLSEGQVQDSKVTCPWHGAQFDIKSGAVLQGPAANNITCYKVKIEGDDIYLEV